MSVTYFSLQRHVLAYVGSTDVAFQKGEILSFWGKFLERS